MNSEEVTENNPITLKKYLEDNKDLLTILGIFVAIVAFSNNLSIKLLAAFISFASFSCATIVLIEFWRKRVAKNPPLSVQLFRGALFFLALGFFLYWFTVFDAIYPDLIFPVLVLLITEVIGWLLSKTRQKNKSVKNYFARLKKRKVKRWIVGIVVALAILAAARQVANLVDVPVFKAVVWIITVSNKITGPIQ